ncbi:hypothetical protein tpqmel_0556, partial [Candidatus Gastranaerophilus sp. (ex Termes propinquus)]
LLEIENKKLKDTFNGLNEFYEGVLKKTGKKNLLIGAAVGLALGVVGVIAKIQYDKSKGKS